VDQSIIFLGILCKYILVFTNADSSSRAKITACSYMGKNLSGGDGYIVKILLVILETPKLMENTFLKEF
jgi:hypothetical protein